ncbi:obscurin, partial [Hyalella azteca]|uniref:Obscurin n=1 Tax=Hyalella azteca TaxID=294128 RepID=A0A8B7PII0_HYAAZ
MLAEIRNFRPKKKRSSAEDEARAKRSATIAELLETEEELVRDLHFAVDRYYHHLDLPTTPRHVTDARDILFGNFNFFPDFHKNVLIEGLKYNAETPRLIGKTFLRLERDFDQHAEYCSSEPLAQEFLENNAAIREYFEDLSSSIGDEKRLQEHL